MSEVKEKLTSKFGEIFGRAPGDDYEPRVRNALKIICQNEYEEEDLIEIVDTSIFSNGISGMVLTIDSVCVDDLGNSTSEFIAKYEEIDYTYIREDEFWGMDISALELNMKDGTVNKISTDKLDRNKLMDFIDYAMSLYQGEGAGESETEDRSAELLPETSVDKGEPGTM